MSSIFIQLIGFSSTILFFASFQCKDTKKLFHVQFASYILYTLHFLLLGAFSGAVSYMINTVRSFCLGSSNDFAKSRAMCTVLCLLQVGVLFLTWAGWYSLLPIAANIAATIAGYTRNGKKLRLANMLINSPLWIIYSLIVGSYAGILDEVVSEASMIISVCRYGWKELDKINS